MVHHQVFLVRSNQDQKKKIMVTKGKIRRALGQSWGFKHESTERCVRSPTEPRDILISCIYVVTNVKMRFKQVFRKHQRHVMFPQKTKGQMTGHDKSILLQYTVSSILPFQWNNWVPRGITTDPGRLNTDECHPSCQQTKGRRVQSWMCVPDSQSTCWSAWSPSLLSLFLFHSHRQVVNNLFFCFFDVS